MYGNSFYLLRLYFFIEPARTNERALIIPFLLCCLRQRNDASFVQIGGWNNYATLYIIYLYIYVYIYIYIVVSRQKKAYISL